MFAVGQLVISMVSSIGIVLHYYLLTLLYILLQLGVPVCNALFAFGKEQYIEVSESMDQVLLHEGFVHTL